MGKNGRNNSSKPIKAANSTVKTTPKSGKKRKLNDLAKGGNIASKVNHRQCKQTEAAVQIPSTSQSGNESDTRTVVPRPEYDQENDLDYIGKVFKKNSRNQRYNTRSKSNAIKKVDSQIFFNLPNIANVPSIPDSIDFEVNHFNSEEADDVVIAVQADEDDFGDSDAESDNESAGPIEQIFPIPADTEARQSQGCSMDSAVETQVEVQPQTTAEPSASVADIRSTIREDPAIKEMF